MKVWLAQVALSTVTFAIIREEQTPVGSKHIKLDTTHEEHTTKDDGTFKHPFAEGDPEVSSIYFNGSKTIS